MSRSKASTIRSAPSSRVWCSLLLLSRCFSSCFLDQSWAPRKRRRRRFLSGDPAEAGLPPAYRLVFYDSIGSTNDEAKRLARDGAAAGTLVWALAQTAGRGRRGRGWVSPPGNLYTSLVMRPDCPPDRAAQLGF